MQDLGSKMQADSGNSIGQNGYAILFDVSSQQTPVLWADATSVTHPRHRETLRSGPSGCGGVEAEAPKPSTPAPPATKKQ